MSKKKVYPYELIGEEIEIISSKNKNNLGLCGKIIDESKTTLKLEIKSKEKSITLIKNNLMFKLSRSGKIIEGISLLKRPEERLKG